MGKRGKETEYEDEYEYDWGTIRKWEGRDRSQRAEYFFEWCLSHRSEEDGTPPQRRRLIPFKKNFTFSLPPSAKAQ
jgi:hypothetical protein